MRIDYRVKVRVEFTVDVGQDSAGNARRFVEYMTEHVFKEDFSRAKNLVVDAYDVQAAPAASEGQK